MSSFFSSATLTIATIFIVFYFWAKYKQTYWSRRGVYSPPAHWFFGHLRDAILMQSSPQRILAEFHRVCSDKPIVGFYVFQKPFLLLRDHEVIKHVFVKDSQVFPDRYFAANRKRDIIEIAGLFSIDSPRWKYLRTKLSSAFTSGKQKKLFDLMLERAANMRDHLASRVSNDDDETTTIEARRVSTKYTTDVISSLSFGIRTNSFDEPEPEFYARSREVLSSNVGHTAKLFVNFFFPRLNDFVFVNALHPYTNYFRQIFWESMNEREQSGVKRGDIIDLLVELKNEQQSEEFAFKGDYLLAQSHNFFVAGLDTSATTMCFTLMELARHRDIQVKVRDELQRKLDNKAFTYECVSEITYLQQAIKETLRLHPIAPLLDRAAVEDYKIPGTDIVIEKGTAVYTNLIGLHYDPEHHPNPTAYDPDRFSEQRKQTIKPCTYMPFGEGPRICIAKRTGVLMTMVGLITILREYEVSWDPKYKSEMNNRTLFGAPSDGIHLSFKRSPIMNALNNCQ